MHNGWFVASAIGRTAGTSEKIVLHHDISLLALHSLGMPAVAFAARLCKQAKDTSLAIKNAE